jgi:hypothetical protein
MAAQVRRDAAGLYHVEAGEPPLPGDDAGPGHYSARIQFAAAGRPGLAPADLVGLTADHLRRQVEAGGSLAEVRALRFLELAGRALRGEPANPSLGRPAGDAS